MRAFENESSKTAELVDAEQSRRRFQLIYSADEGGISLEEREREKEERVSE